MTHGNLVANLQQTAAWIARDLADGKGIGVIPLPRYHVLALTANLVVVSIGAHVILITNPRGCRLSSRRRSPRRSPS